MSNKYISGFSKKKNSSFRFAATILKFNKSNLHRTLNENKIK